MVRTRDEAARAHAETQKAYYARMREAGMVRVSHWIPKEAKDDFEDRLEKLRQLWRKQGLLE